MYLIQARKSKFLDENERIKHEEPAKLLVYVIHFEPLDLAGIGLIQKSINPAMNYFRNITISRITVMVA